MMISTKGRYALRTMIDLAELDNGSYIPTKIIAERQEISLKYLERILPSLVEQGLIDGMRGKGGGYKLNRAPDEYSVWEILTAAEGDLSPVSCLENGAEKCPREQLCSTVSMWRDFYRLTEDYFKGISLADLMSSPAPDNYVI